jgi:hypothetical protein
MASGTWNTGFWGQNQWNDLADPTFTLTGVSLSGVLGTTTEIDGQINTGWGRIEWGLNAWGEFGTALPTGIAASFSIGSITTQIDVTATNSTNNNQTITGALGSVAIDIAVVTFPSGLAATTTLGTADASPDALATTNHATMNLGTIDAYNQTGWSRQQWNVNAWGVEGQYATATPTGIAMNANIETPTITGTANLTLNTLNVANATLGVVDPAPDAEVTGNFMIGTLGQLGMQGDVPQDVTGIAMSANLGSVVVVPGQEVPLTGLPGLARVASVTAIIHVDVLLTGNALTMAQGSGSALIWNEVNTGTAPIDPPGWQEVAA